MKTVTLASGTVKAIAAASNGTVYVARDGTYKLLRIDFSAATPSSQEINDYCTVEDIDIDGNNNLLLAVGSAVKLLRQPYSLPAITILAFSESVKYIATDASGGVYCVKSVGDIMYLPAGYTNSYQKNACKAKQTYSPPGEPGLTISGFDVGAQYDMVMGNSTGHTILGFIGSRSDPTKTDSDGDGLQDGYGSPSSPYDGELDTIQLTINCNQQITTSHAFPTIADSDGDGLNDGAELQARSLDVTIMGGGTGHYTDIRSDPSRNDTDGDGLTDGKENRFTNPMVYDTDHDGLRDGTEDANHNGRIDPGETSPVCMDSDGDLLADGWCDFGINGNWDSSPDSGEMDGVHQSGETPGEDFNFSGQHDANEPDPTKIDSDGDTISDKTEVDYLTNCSLPFNHDADGDSIPDVMETDADADGLGDLVENYNRNAALDSNETNPYDYDTDHDGLPDGAEPSPFCDIDEDGWINARDTFLNFNGSHCNSTNDFNSTFVLFRTTAPFSTELGMSAFGPGTYIATLNTTSKDLVNFSSDYISLTRYSYIGPDATLPPGMAPIIVTLNGAQPREVQTPDGRGVYFAVIAGRMTVYICSTVGGQQSGYFKYRATANQSVNASLRVNWVNGHINEIIQRQVTIDWRMTLSLDNDFDGVNNSNESGEAACWDRDIDDDGLMDGIDPYYNNSDGDGDGLPDGLEMGVQVPVPPLGSMINGTNWNPNTPQNNPTFTWNSPAGAISVPRFIIDQDPTTITNPKYNDTDGDGINDGIEDCDVTSLNSTHAIQSTDLDGKFDGSNETKPLDRDSDDDGLADGSEDADHDGLWDWNPTQSSGETCSWTFDSDADGLGDGLEAGKILKDVISDTDPSIFIPDADSTTHTNPLKVDSDFDGVPDGWIDGWGCAPDGTLGVINVPDHEFQWGEGEDLNFNGIKDATETEPSPSAPNCLDSDGDHLADGWDILNTTHSLTNIAYTFENGVYRHWGELNFSTHLLGTRGTANVYQSGPTDPTNIDSDGDGLVDGNISLNDLPCELVMSHNGISQTMWTDPSLQDTDGDGLSDGMEIAGWEVHVILEKTKVEVRNWTVRSNPTILDMDSDGVNDYQEFENQSDPNNNDTDSDHILDQYEDQGELTQVDGKDPEILKFEDGKQVKVSVHITYYGIVPTGIKMVISVRLKDNAGLEYVYVKLEGQSPQNHSFKNHQRYVDQIDLEFDMDWLRSLTGGYDINITVADVNGNGNCTTTHIDGLAEGVVKALIKGFWSFVEAVKKFASELFDWIWNALQSLFLPVIQTFNNMLQSVVNGMSNAIRPLTQTFNTTDGKGWEENLKYIVDLMGSVAIFLNWMYIVMMILDVANILVSSGPWIILMFTIQTFLSTFIMAHLLGVVVSGSINNPPSNFGPLEVSKMKAVNSIMIFLNKLLLDFDTAKGHSKTITKEINPLTLSILALTLSLGKNLLPWKEWFGPIFGIVALIIIDIFAVWAAWKALELQFNKIGGFKWPGLKEAIKIAVTIVTFPIVFLSLSTDCYDLGLAIQHKDSG